MQGAMDAMATQFSNNFFRVCFKFFRSLNIHRPENMGLYYFGRKRAK